MAEATGSPLSEALVAAQAEMPAVDRDGTNPHFKSKFATLGNLLAKAKPVLNKHGLAVAQFPAKDEQGNPTLVTVLLHKSGERMEYEAPLLLPKNDPQGQGSAITYMRRYALASALGICDQDDDDGTAGSRPTTTRKGGASGKQASYAGTLVGEAGFSADQLAAIRTHTCKGGKLTSQGASFLIENLKDGTAEGRTAVLQAVGWSDIPVDTTDFEHDGAKAPEDPVAL